MGPWVHDALAVLVHRGAEAIRLLHPPGVIRLEHVFQADVHVHEGRSVGESIAAVVVKQSGRTECALACGNQESCR